MNRKTIVLITLTALVSGLLYALPTFASAPFQEGQPPSQNAAAETEGQPPPRLRGGEIMAVEEHSLTVQPFAEEAAPLTVFVNEATAYRTKDGTLTFEDLQPGDKIALSVRPDENGTLTARRIILLPDDFDPQKFQRHVVRGEVWSIDPQAGTFTIQTRRGNEQLTFFVDENTAFHSRGDIVQSLDDLQIHTQVGIRGNRQEDGTFLAADVLIPRPRLSQHTGTIASIDESNLRLTLDRRDGQTITFRVIEQTRFKGAAEGLSDLQPGMKARVSAFQDGDGQWTAVLIGARAAQP